MRNSENSRRSLHDILRGCYATRLLPTVYSIIDGIAGSTQLCDLASNGHQGLVYTRKSTKKLLLELTNRLAAERHPLDQSPLRVAVLDVMAIVSPDTLSTEQSVDIYVPPLTSQKDFFDWILKSQYDMFLVHAFDLIWDIKLGSGREFLNSHLSENSYRGTPIVILLRATGCSRIYARQQHAKELVNIIEVVPIMENFITRPFVCGYD
jgi:hypothetical protein